MRARRSLEVKSGLISLSSAGANVSNGFVLPFVLGALDSLPESIREDCRRRPFRCSPLPTSLVS